MNQNMGSTGRIPGSQKASWIQIAVVCVLATLLLGGIALGLMRKGRGKAWQGRTASSKQGTDSQDEFSVSSAARDAGPDSKQGTYAGADRNQPANRATEQLAAQSAAQQAAQQTAAQQAAMQQAAAQQAAQAAELAEKNRELEQKAAEQAAREQQLQQDRLRLEAEKQKADAADVEQIRRAAAARQAKAAVYSGPSSGNIVWQGEVHGTALVTINGSASDNGQILSGALPGVLVMVQPSDGKHVGVASSPAPSNGFERLTLRIQGNGVLQEVIHWSIP